MKPSHEAPINPWRLYVAAGSTRDERRARLAECPGEYREGVQKWVEHFFAEDRNARRK